MDTTKTFRHQDYELRCTAKAVDSGKFEPNLVVSRQSWPTRPRVVLLKNGAYATRETAIDAARTQGIEWVSNFG
jgi:hypothetical protein